MDLKKLYNSLISNAIMINGRPESMQPHHTKKGFERHHITPRSLKGSDESYNLVFLTPKQHYTAHHILARLYGGGLSVAFFMMSHKNQLAAKDVKITSRQYQTAKELRSKAKIYKRKLTAPERKAMKKKMNETRLKNHKKKYVEDYEESLVVTQRKTPIKKQENLLTSLEKELGLDKNQLIEDLTKELQIDW